MSDELQSTSNGICNESDNEQVTNKPSSSKQSELCIVRLPKDREYLRARKAKPFVFISKNRLETGEESTSFQEQNKVKNVITKENEILQTFDQAIHSLTTDYELQMDTKTPSEATRPTLVKETDTSENLKKIFIDENDKSELNKKKQEIIEAITEQQRMKRMFLQQMTMIQKEISVLEKQAMEREALILATREILGMDNPKKEEN